MNNPKKQPLWSRNFISLCSSELLMTLAFYSTMPMIALFLEQRIGLSGTPLGMVVVSATVAAIIARIMSGYLLDLVGRRVVFWVAFALFTGLYFLYPFANTIMHATLLRFGHGLAWGAGMTAATTIAVDISPEERKGEAIGNYTLFMMVAMAVGPAIGMALLTAESFEFLFISAGGLGLLGLLAILWLRFPKIKLEKRALSLDSLFEKNALWLGLVVFFISVPYGCFMNYGAMYATNELKTPAGLFYALFAISTASSRLFSGKMYDKHGPRLIVALALILSFAGLVVMGLTENHVLFYAATVLVGVADGMGLPVLIAMVNNLVSPQRRGEANGTLMTFFEMGICGGVLLVSALYKSAGWPVAFMALAGAVVLAAIVWRTVALPYYKSKTKLS